MTDTTVLVGVVVALATLVIQHFVGPLIAPWYAERLQKIQLRIERRRAQRLMIENELGKGFDDLSAVRAFIIAVRVGGPSTAAMDTAGKFMTNLTMHEEKWGVWRSYLIEDKNLERLCEDFRSFVRALRMDVLSSSEPLQLTARVDAAEEEMRRLSRAVISDLDERNW